MHNFYALNDPLQFVRKVSDLFVGLKVGDVAMEGNPWKWDGTDWIEIDTYDIEIDFPPITVWESKMNAVDNALCFRHIRREESLANSKAAKENAESASIIPNLINTEINKNSTENRSVQRINESNISLLTKDFPAITHSLLIIECVRTIMKKLKNIFKKNNANYSKCKIYKKNKTSFRFLIDQLSMPDKPSYDILCSLLFALPVKENNLESQIRDINDGVRSLRKNNHSYIDYIRINDSEFDLSQESVSEHSLHSIREIPAKARHERSCD